MTWLAALAAEAPVPVYPAVGPGCLAAVERLLAGPRLARAVSPRHAAMLLVAGDMPAERAGALDRLHDQVPKPRLCVRWDGRDPAVEQRLVDGWRALCTGASGAPDRRADTPPNEWRGRGDHGQGGEGMMGGVPYGRPMAMTGDDIRDGLALDRYTARIGPFAPMLPPGLVLEVTLAGDVIAAARVCAPPFRQPEDADAPVLCAARMLRLLGLAAAADRMIAGGRPPAPWACCAVPSGLACLDGEGDARARLRRWLAGRPTRGAGGLFGTLAGLEWSEAVLALASVTPSALERAARRACAQAEP